QGPALRARPPVTGLPRTHGLYYSTSFAHSPPLANLGKCAFALPANVVKCAFTPVRAWANAHSTSPGTRRMRIHPRWATWVNCAFHLFRHPCQRKQGETSA